jgi:hypothetical protein
MKILTRAVLFIALLGQGNALAHSNHNVISGQTALSVANKSVKQLTFKYLVLKLENSMPVGRH